MTALATGACIAEDDLLSSSHVQIDAHDFHASLKLRIGTLAHRWLK